MSLKKYLLVIASIVLSHLTFAGDFYWVGNSGNWNDAKNWASVSGGVGGIGIPGLNDNVFIDEKSFSLPNQSIEISSPIKLNNLTVGDVAIPFTINSSTNSQIEIYGSLDVRATYITNNIKGDINFVSETNNTKTVNFGNWKWNANINFNGNGKYEFQSQLAAYQSTINLLKGEIDLNEFSLVCNTFNSTSPYKRKLIAKNAAIVCYDGWNSTQTKFNHDLNQAKTYVINADPNAVQTDGEDFGLAQSQTSFSKTVTNAAVVDDTVSCGNNCDGELTVTFNTDCPNGFVSWLPGPTDNYNGECQTCPIPGPNGSNTITDLCPGTYTAVITNDCDGGIAAVNGDVEGHPSIVELVHTENETSCQGVCDGSTGIFVTGATYAEFSYLWFTTGDPADTTTSLSNLCAGLYQIEVQDGFGCIDTFDFNVQQPDSMYANVTATDISCFGECTGTATSNPTGGTAPFSYSWNPGADTTQGITGLCMGNYTVSVTDANGCVNDTTVAISEPDSMVVNGSANNISCGGLCDGSITANVISGGSAPFTHNWSTGFSETANSSTIGALCAGTYHDTIVDANGCDTVLTFTIIEPTPLTTSTTFSNVNCFGACDGFAITTPAGGTAPYTPVWNTVPTQTTDSIGGLCPGQYIVNIEDDAGCTVSDTVEITEPDALAVNPSSTDVSCNGVCDGTATSAPTGGTTPYTYNWSTVPSQSSQGVNSLCAGTYIITVTDSNNCIATDSVIVTEPQPIVLNINSTDMSCNGVCDGASGVDVSGGTTPYTYIWSSIPGGQVTSGQGTDSIFDLCAGDYTVTVTDSNGCSSNTSATVNEPNPIVPNLTTSDLSCNGVCNGTASVAPAGGTTPYTVSWNGGAFAAATSITGLCAGSHTVEIRDANGCTTLLAFDITEPDPLTTSTTGNDVSCFGVCDGEATSNPVGGSGAYTFSWNTVPAQNGATANNLCAGTYIVTVTDDSLCTVNDTITIDEPNVLDANAQSTNMSCNGVCDGSVISLPTGGTAPYTYSWNPGTATQSMNSLCAGTYIVTVTDSNNCTALDTVEVTDPTPLTVNANSVNASCGAVCDGEAIANPSGGTTPYTYSWNTGDTTQTASNLCAGTYGVTVTDSAGCTALDSVTIVDLIVISIVTDTIGISCNGACDGEATANPSGGQTPYTYSWNTVPVQTGQTATGLCPGTYTVTVTDVNGCNSTTSVNMPTDPDVLVPNGTATNVSCNGLCDGTLSSSPTGGVPPYTVVWSVADTSAVCTGTYTVTVTDANNCSQTDTLVVNEPDSISSNPVISDVDCNGNCNGAITLNAFGGTGTLTYLWLHDNSTNADVSALCAGNYSVIVTDSTGCSRQFDFTIAEPSALATTPVSTDASCNGDCDGTASVIVGGGTTPYTYFWSPGGETTSSINGLCAGNYQVTITDSNNCVINDIVSVGEPTPIQANLTGEPIACNGDCDGEATVAPSGGTAPYTYVWTSSGDTSATITNLCIGTYPVEITDANGCIATDSYDVTSPPMLQVTLDSTNINCNGSDNGDATVTPIGGTPPYSYSWAPGGESTNSISGLSPGVYTVTVTDSLGCFFTGSVNIEEPNAIDDNEVITNANCGFNDGSISMNPSGGTPPYSHSWSNGETTSTITGLGVGFYTDTITDLNGCIEIFTIAISNPSGPTGVTATVNDASCFGDCDGSANVIPIGGTPGYTYLWAPGGETDSTINNQCAGTYNLTITDAQNCVLNTSVIIGEADSITDNLVFGIASCDGVCDATASVSPSGGTAPYTFLWSDGSTASSTAGLCAGAASVTITDAAGCTKTVNFTITSPNALNLVMNSTDANCNGDCDGEATVTATGGTAPFSYLWNDPLSQTDSNATALCPGSYDVMVTDVNGCSSTISATINEPSLMVANESTTDASCGANDGSATVAPTGGTSPYTYSWDVGPTTATVNGLAAGSYTVTITDSNNCSQDFPIAISNTTGPDINVTSNDASCNGVCDGDATVNIVSGTPNFSILWSSGQTTSSVTGLCSGSYTVEVTDGLGCISTEVVTISENSQISANLTTIDATCNGACDGSAMVVPSGGLPPYSYNWSTGHTINAVGGLCAGSYTVTITDALGCAITENVTISESSLITLNTSAIDANCSGTCDGEATVTASGGTTPYTYTWSNGATTPNIVGLCAGTYDVTVTDVNGCSNNATVTIGENTTITATITANDATCGVCDGDATITPVGGSGAPYDVLWLPGGETTNTVTGLCPGAYDVEVTDNGGCIETFNVIISNPNGPDITADSDSIDCFGNCNGNAWVTINTGTAPFVSQWDDPLLQTTDTATNLCGGLYNIVVQDANGCISVDSTTIFEPEVITANITTTPLNCDGDNNGTATANPTGGTGNYQYSWNTVPVQTSQTATGLTAGTYIVTITDDNNCSIMDSVTLTAPNVIDITINATTVTCNGDCDGTALATASGGTAPYSYVWDDPSNQPNSLAAGLCANLYTVTVTDANGCIATDTVSVIEPDVLTTNSTPTALTCNGNCDGSITTTPTGGAAPYTFLWSDGQTTQTASNLCAGTYTVTVIDANNCTVTDTVDLTEPTTVTGNVAVTGPTCGLCDGDATANPSGGTGPYTYLWGDGQTTQTAVGLCAGIISLEITDQGTGCTYTEDVIVNSTNGPTVSTTFTNETCVGNCDGTATATASGGTTPYTYDWNPTGQTTETATGLCIGFYTVTVTDSQNCVTTDTLTITTNGLDLAITNVVPESCFGNCDGEATVTNSAGVAPYTYLWTPTGQTTETATGLCVGTYTATVTDALNCSDSISTTITGPDSLDITIVENTPIGCNGTCNGQVTASVNGGSAPYTFAWDNGETDATITDLCAGTYMVTVTDANGCSGTASITLTEPTQIVANEVLTLPSCNQCDGAITVVPSGGIGPYSFVWSPGGETTSLINNLCAGAYSVTITDDASGCSVDVPFALSNSNAPVANVTQTPVSCNGVCDGELTSSPTGGTAPYSFMWNPTGQTSATATGLCAGVYNLEVTDDSGCVGISIDTLIAPDILEANITSDDILCNGSCDGWAVINPTGGNTPYQTAIWSPGNTTIDSITNLCAGTYTVSVTDDNGCIATDSVTINEPTAITLVSTSTDVSCSSVCDGTGDVTASGGIGPYTYSWTGGQNAASVTDLCLGINVVTVTDQNNCSVMDSLIIGATDTVFAQAGPDTIVCLNTPFTLTGTPTGTFTDVEWFELNGMTSIGTNNTITITPTAIGVQCYVYQVNGACSDMDTVCVTVEDLPIIDAGNDVTILEDTSTPLSATGGVTYQWSPGTGLSDSTISNPIASPTETTVYYVTGTNASGCFAVDSVIVTVIPTIQFPDGITPNGDGKNDTWVIDYIEFYPDHVVEIYNRWGEMLFRSDDYQNDWDGTYNGQQLPIGTYYYVIDLNDGKNKPFTGPITILR